MIWLALAVACSVSIATLFKATERRDVDRTALLATNYAAGAVLALALQGNGLGSAADAGLAASTWPFVALGAAQGVLFIGGFWLFSLAIRRAGMGLAAGVMRLSVVVPVIASAVVWGEAVSPFQMAGLALAGVAFALVSRPADGLASAATRAAAADGAALAGAVADAPPASGGGRAFGLLGLLFLVGGAVDVLNKAFTETYGGAADRSLFLLVVFGVAFALGAVVVVADGVRTGRWPTGETYAWGAVLGVVNYASADFFLRAIAWAGDDAAFVFPANSVAIVVGAAVIGTLVWGERLSRANVAGLAVAAVALVLLGQ